MPAIELAANLYEQAKIRAAAAGFATVDEYVADLLQGDASDPKDLDLLFTPDRIAKLDQIVGDIERGEKLLTDEEVDQHFNRRRSAWQGK